MAKDTLYNELRDLCRGTPSDLIASRFAAELMELAQDAHACMRTPEQAEAHREQTEQLGHGRVNLFRRTFGFHDAETLLPWKNGEKGFQLMVTLELVQQ